MHGDAGHVTSVSQSKRVASGLVEETSAIDASDLAISAKANVLVERLDGSLAPTKIQPSSFKRDLRRPVMRAQPFQYRGASRPWYT